MAKKRFRIKDKQGNVVDYDISAASVTLDVEGKSLDVKLSELADAIAASLRRVSFNGTQHVVANNTIDLGNQMQANWDESDTGYPSYIRNKPNVVTGIKVGESGTTQTPTNGVVTLPEPSAQVTVDDEMSSTSANAVQNKVIKAYVESLISGLINGAPAALDTLKELADALGDNEDAVAALTTAIASKVSGIKIGSSGQTYQPSNGIVTLPEMGGGLTEEDISVSSNQDGTVDINVGNDSYTINLNHTHENMARLVICEESDLPSTMAMDTIYAQVDDAETPTEIQSLWIAGLEFVGGGGGVLPDEPILSRPNDGSTIDFGKGDSLTKTITIKGRNLAHDLALELSGSGYSFGTTQPTGVTRTDGTHMTITATTANTGVDIVVDYAETGLYADGTLEITGSNDGIDTEVTLVANTDVVVYWDGGDAVQSGKWVDRVNQIPFVLNGTAEKTADGYHLNNLSSQRNAYMLTDSSKNTLLNTLIKKEFTCYVDFKLKFGTAGKSSTTIDFGVNGEALSTLAFGCTVKQDGTIITTFKLNGDQTGFFEKENYAQLDSALTLNSYVTLQLKIGARILANGKQELYTEIDGKKCYAVLNYPVDFNFAGCGGDYPVASAASLGYGFDRNATTDFPNGSYDIVYQKIVIYNTAR